MKWPTGQLRTAYFRRHSSCLYSNVQKARGQNDPRWSKDSSTDFTHDPPIQRDHQRNSEQALAEWWLNNLFHLSFLTIISNLFVTALWDHHLDRCLTQKPTGGAGTTFLFRLFRNKRIRPHIYNGQGACRHIVRTKTFIIDHGICLPLDVFSHIVYVISPCRPQARTNNEYIRCVWNNGTVPRSKVDVHLQQSIAGRTMSVESFADGECTPWHRLDSGCLTIEF